MKNKEFYILILMILLFTQLTLSSQYKSLVSDEILDLSAGYYYLKTGDFGLNPTHPPLGRIISALPLLLLDLNFPETEPGIYQAEDFSKDFFYVYNDNIDEMFFYGRMPIILLSIILGLYIFRWSSELYGDKAGLFALFVYTFHPIILGHFALTMTDPFVTVFGFISTYYFYKFIKKPNNLGTLISGIMLGLTISSKATGLFFIPIYLIMILYMIWKNRSNKPLIKSYIIKFISIIIIAVIIFMGFYGFELRTIDSVIFNESRHEQIVNQGSKIPLVGENIEYFIQNVPIPLTWFLKGLYIEAIPDVLEGKFPTYVFGEVSKDGFFHYFITGFILKNPIPFLIFISISILFFTKLKKENSTELLIILPIIVWFLFFSFSKLSFGLRHILPTLPFIILFISRIMKLKMDRYITIIFVLLSAWIVIASLMAFPFYISYYNELSEDNYYIGFEDSGQAYKQLKYYMQKNNISKIYLIEPRYWIPFELEYRNIEYEKFCGKVEGIIVVGKQYKTFLTLQNKCHGWLYNMDYSDKIGDSLLIYNIN